MQFPLLLDPPRTPGRDYRVDRLPMMVFVDRAGVLRVGAPRIQGAVTKPLYVRELRALLDE